MVDLSGAMGLMNNLPSIMDLVTKSIFLIICFFLGNLAWKGWTRYKNWGLNIVVSLLMTLVILYSSITLASVIPIQLPYIPYGLNALIVALILYASLKLISGGKQQIAKLVTRESYNKLRDEFDELKKKFNHLVKVLERKGVMPEPLSAKKIREELNKALERKGYKDFIVNSRETQEDVKVFDLQIKGVAYKAVMDLYTGDLVSLDKIDLDLSNRFKKTFKRLTSNKRVLTGMIVLLLFATTTITLMDAESISEASSYLQLSLTPNVTALSNPECLTVSDALSVYASSEEAIFNESILSTLEGEQLPYKAFSYNGTNYALVLTMDSVSNFMNTLTNKLITNPASITSLNVCELTTQTITIHSVREDRVCDSDLLTNHCSEGSNYIKSLLMNQALDQL